MAAAYENIPLHVYNTTTKHCHCLIFAIAVVLCVNQATTINEKEIPGVMKLLRLRSFRFVTQRRFFSLAESEIEWDLRCKRACNSLSWMIWLAGEWGFFLSILVNFTLRDTSIEALEQSERGKEVSSRQASKPGIYPSSRQALEGHFSGFIHILSMKHLFLVYEWINGRHHTTFDWSIFLFSTVNYIGTTRKFQRFVYFFFCTFNGDFQTHFDEVSSSQSQLLTSNENCLIVT